MEESFLIGETSIRIVKSEIDHAVNGTLGQKNMTISDLAAKMGFPAKTVYNLLSGDNARLLRAFDLIIHLSNALEGEPTSFAEKVLRKAFARQYKTARAVLSFNEIMVLELYNSFTIDEKELIIRRLKSKDLRETLMKILVEIATVAPSDYSKLLKLILKFKTDKGMRK